MSEYHKILKRQIRKILVGQSDYSAGTELGKLFVSISDTYNHFDEDRNLIERSLDISTRELNDKAILLEITLNSIIEGILVVDNHGNVVIYNERYVEIWNMPSEIILTRDSKKILDFVSDQVKDPVNFLEKIRGIYDQLDEKSTDILELKNGNVIERYSQPQKTSDGVSIGRVWSFLDITKHEQEKQNDKMIADENSRMNRMMVGREIRMIELKEEIKKLKEGLGESIK